MQIKDVFSVPLYSTILNVDNELLERYCMQLKDETPGRKLSNIGGWQSDNFHDPVPQPLEELFAIIGDHVNQFAIQIRLLPSVFQNAWININGYKDYNALHTHPHSTFSGVYYVKANPEMSGKLTFRHPDSEMLMGYGWQQDIITEHNKYNSGLYSFDVYPGLLYLFPSWLRHEVLPNLSETENRISISFNYKA